MDSVVPGLEAAHIVHLLRVNDHPSPRVQKRKDRPRLDRDRLEKRYSFFTYCSRLLAIQCMRIGWLFLPQPPTSSLASDKYCLRSSTFHARLPPPVP
ncbi:hypothetical protein CesoFtcFv8_015298 [Champsocephalus esox]|uniref:Uncharacterized protein n=2 Tax=Channichthyidae TaxID=30806 RepID=A0AAN8GT62_9TELE|nr:hypothetical protein KUCAC02_018562 [Chaenocephalus aceratus]KAK5889282.1 hypothetical protein CesoFtcFv8_015298 [Champsocephalus esox]